MLIATFAGTENAQSKLLFLNNIRLYSLDVGTDLSTSDILNPSVLCKSGEALNNKCNEVKYATGMKVDSKSGLVKCDWAKNEKCNYLNSDNSTVTRDCSCALNPEGDSWCPTSQFDSNYLN